jgi:PIN domain nuclease of toxin-antitoxin system
VAIAVERVQWTRDPFDRLIVAQALLHDAPLITKDEHIRRHYAGALW